VLILQLKKNLKSDFAPLTEKKMPFYPEYTYPKKSGAWYIELNIDEIKEYIENLLEKKYGKPLIKCLRPNTDIVVSDDKKFHNYVCELEVELNQCDSMPENFWEWLDENYKEMKSWKTVEKEFIDKECIEYEVEYGYMIDEDTYGESHTSCFEGWAKELAIEEFERLKQGYDYDFVYLFERTMEGEDCLFTTKIMKWYSPKVIDWDLNRIM
jgi:hypothetical protein